MNNFIIAILFALCFIINILIFLLCFFTSERKACDIKETQSLFVLHGRNILGDAIILLICNWFAKRMYTLTITPISLTIPVFKIAGVLIWIVMIFCLVRTIFAVTMNFMSMSETNNDIFMEKKEKKDIIKKILFLNLSTIFCAFVTIYISINIILSEQIY